MSNGAVRQAGVRVRRRVTVTSRSGRGAALAALALLAALFCALAWAPASLAKAQPNPEFEEFAQCPVTVKKVAHCLAAHTTSGEFKLAGKTVHINKTITLQGGLIEGSNMLVPAANGETLSKTPLTVGGGVLGVEGLEAIGGEVTAITELAGPVHVYEENLEGAGPAVVMPIKLKLENPLLGEACYVGSEAEPVTLHLTTGMTAPPAPAKPISGNPGTASFNAALTIITISGTSLVDNTFAAPAASGCGGSLSGVLDAVVDLQVGLPSAAGNNTAILDGSLAETTAKLVKKAKVTQGRGTRR